MQNKIKIVIADDNPKICSMWKDILMGKGYLVETVKDGYELLGYLTKKTAHILILDLMMPEKSGIEIFSAVRNSAPNTKIIIYTGFQRYENSIYARIADNFLLKGDNPGELLQAIEELHK